MAKEKGNKPTVTKPAKSSKVIETPKEEVVEIVVEETTETPIVNEGAESVEELTKEVEVVTEVKETQKLVSKQVFEPMQGHFRTVWVKE